MLTDAARIVRFWQAVETFNPRPLPRPDFREKFRKAAAAQAKKRKSEEMV